MANKFSGIVEEKAASESNGSTLYKFKVGGKFYSAYENSLTSDVVESARIINQGDEVEGEFVQKTSKAGRSYNNFTAIIRVDRPESVQPDGRPSPDAKNRSVALSYAKDLVVAGKIEMSEIYTYADSFLAYMTGAKDEDGQGEF